MGVKNIMKICIVGLGSIGKRHLKNIKYVLEKRGIENCIDLLRSNIKRLDNEIDVLINQQYYDVKNMPDNYDIVFITNPTVFHYDTIGKMSKKTRHMFIEKPVFDKTGYNLNNLKLNNNSVYYVACPLRHKSVIKYIHRLINDGEKFISIRAKSSSYLPGWRNETDYRKNYSAHKNMGGGVLLDLIHEWDYITYLFGSPLKIFKISGKYSDLDIDSDDIAIYIAEYNDMVAEVHLDYLGINAERTLELIGNKIRLKADLLKNHIVCYENNLRTEIQFEEEDFYLKEMEYFIDVVMGKKENINTIESAADLLQMVL